MDPFIGMGPPSRRMPTVLIGSSGAREEEGGCTVNFGHWRRGPMVRGGAIREGWWGESDTWERRPEVKRVCRRPPTADKQRERERKKIVSFHSKKCIPLSWLQSLKKGWWGSYHGVGFEILDRQDEGRKHHWRPSLFHDPGTFPCLPRHQ